MKRHPVRKFLLISLLALLCITGAELAASRHFAPAFYNRVMTPVRKAAQQAADAACRFADQAVEWGHDTMEGLADWGHNAMENLADWRENLSDTMPEENRQMASEPAVSASPPPVSDPSITELIVQNGQEVLTGGVLPVIYFNQGDPNWGDKPYGTDNIRNCGCGPTAMAMAASSITGVSIDPESMARWAYENRQWVKNSGSRLSIVNEGAKAYGMVAESVPPEDRTSDVLIDLLSSGKLLVALMGPGHFTNNGHFILLRGCTLSGSILVADPNSRDRSLAEWDPQLILGELSRSTASGGPLWTLSLPN